jgi:hypothetical protein
MPINSRNLRKIARIIALVYGIPLLLIIPVALAMANRPWPPSDYIFAGLSILYLVGLFLGLRWQGIGGLISIIFPVYQLLLMIADLIKGPSTGNPFGAFIIFLILSIPCILYLVSWSTSRKRE